VNISKLSIKAKLGLGFGTLTLFVIAIAALALHALTQAHDDFEGYINDTAVRITLANDVLDATNARAIGARNLVLLSTGADREVEKAATVAAHQKVGASIAKLKELIAKSSESKAQEAELAAELERVESKYGPVALDIVTLAMDDKHEEAIQKMNADCRPLLASLLAATNRYNEFASAQSRAQVARDESTFARTRNVMIAACVIAIGLAAALAVIITKGIVRALGAEPSQLSDAARRVADGNLEPIPGVQTAMTGSVLASLADMQSKLARIVGQVRDASDSIATGSAQIAMGNADLSQRTEEQASNLQQTAASMEELNTTVRNNADTARQASQLADAASVAAQNGGTVVGQVVITMDDISASSRKIAEIIAVIDGIAFQTNILALNAAVEAARAGEQGRGFAVVAGEVRNLAQRSAEAAKEIKTLIGNSVEKVQAGARLVGDAGASMEDIVGQVKRVADLINQISSATIEQTAGIGQVSEAVVQLDRATQQNAALVEESAAAAESLRHQASHLTEMVSVFKLGEQTTRPTAAPAQRPAAPRSLPMARATDAPTPKAATVVGADQWETF